MESSFGCNAASAAFAAADIHAQRLADNIEFYDMYGSSGNDDEDSVFDQKYMRGLIDVWLEGIDGADMKLCAIFSVMNDINNNSKYKDITKYNLVLQRLIFEYVEAYLELKVQGLNMLQRLTK